MTINTQAILFGILAGAASALLAGSVLTQTSLAVILFLLSAFPLMVAGLSFGPAAALIGAGVAGLAVAVLVSAPAAMVMLLTTALPAALATVLISLARPADEIGGQAGDTVWYPLADTIFYASLVIAGGFVILGAYAGYGMEFATEFARTMEEQFKVVNPEFVPSAEFAPSLAAFIYRAVPLIQPALLTLALMGSLYLALAVVRPSGRFARPKDDWPLALRMPRAGLLAFGFSLAVSFLPGPVGLTATAFCGALGAAFAAAGLANIHNRLRGKPGRGFVLGLAYLALFLFLPVLFLFVFIGLFDTTRAAPVTKGQPPKTLH
ncbi:MAG: DUF2232 domain-containing protein [Rhizobiaceae bacterium]|nr:DUF2232 domain-containing protein [Rhizobiaceae bacterium]